MIADADPHGMTLRSRLRSTVTLTVGQVKTLATTLERPAQTRHAEDIIDLSVEATWCDVEDLTEDFDQKLAQFMSFDDAAASREWLFES